MLPNHMPNLDSYLNPDRNDSDTLPDCEVCDRRMAVLRDPFNGEYRCLPCDEEHQQDKAERQQEQDFADFHGGDRPFNDAERDAVQGRRHR